MRKKLTIQNISRLFLLTAGILLLAHAAIPHHHHYGFVHHQDTTECSSEAHDNEEETPQSHCNAFNIITASHSGNNNLISFIEAEDIDILFYDKPGTNLVIKKISGTPNFKQDYYPINPFLYSDLSLRGPPSLS
ncbi:MAG: hypothetical protein K9I29_00370 [Bacteroidales bacterium]|nr:hypothetical protein [Bacteroidales bacterium]